MPFVTVTLEYLLKETPPYKPEVLPENKQLVITTVDSSFHMHPAFCEAVLLMKLQLVKLEIAFILFITPATNA